MATIVELYLRDRVVRGQIATRGERALDLFNRSEPAVHLREAQSISFHVAAEPRRLGAIRIDKRQILLVAPYDAERLLRTRLRAAWVPKSKVQAEAGVGPLVVRGTFHVGRSFHTAMSSIFLGSEARQFLPVTDATVASDYHPSWSINLKAVFIPREAIEYVTIPQAGMLPTDRDALEPLAADLSGGGPVALQAR